MKALLRRLLTVLAAISLLLSLAVIDLRVMSGDYSGLIALPLPARHELVLMLHTEGWTEAMLVHPWPDRQIQFRINRGWPDAGIPFGWTGSSWIDSGSFSLGQGFGDIPVAFPYGPADYDGKKNWPDGWHPPTDPNWFRLSGYKLQFPTLFWAVLASLLWIPCLIAASYRLVQARNRRRNHEQGRCEKCGYDLRATPDRCPECGATPTRARR